MDMVLYSLLIKKIKSVASGVKKVELTTYHIILLGLVGSALTDFTPVATLLIFLFNKEYKTISI